MKFKIKKFGKSWCLMLAFSPDALVPLFKHKQYDEVIRYLAYVKANAYRPLAASLISKNMSLRATWR